MSTEEVLSQDEIDALLDKADTVAKKKIREGLSEEVSSYDIFNPPARRSGGIPDMEPLIDRLIERLPSMLDAPLSKIFTLATGPEPELLDFVEFRQTIESPSAMLSHDFRTPTTGMMAMVSRTGTQCLVSALFGGDGKAQERDVLSRTELRVAHQVLKTVMDIVSREECDSAKLDFQTNPVALPGPPEETPLVVQRLNFAVGDGSGELCLAASPEVFAGAQGKPSDEPGNDESWQHQLAQVTSEASVTLSAKAAEVSLGIGDLLRIAPGDFIPVDIDQNVVLCANDQPLLRGLLGVSGAMNAVHILGPVSSSDPTPHRLEQRVNSHE